MSNRRITPSIVLSTLALAVAATGTAGAAGGWINGSSIKPHTITSLQLSKGAVAGVNIKPKAITSKQVKPRSLTALALADGVIVNNTVIAPAGPKGDAGNSGTNGANGVAAIDPSRLTTAVGPDALPLAGGDGTSVAICPAGSYAVGGGYSRMHGPGEVSTVATYPTDSEPYSLTNGSGQSGWWVEAHNTGSSNQTVAWHAIAYCATS